VGFRSRIHVLVMQVMEFLSYMLTNQDLIELGKKQNSYQRIGRIIRAGMKLLKGLLGLRQSDMPGRDIFSQVRFNAGVLMADVALPSGKSDMVLSQSDGNTDARLEMIEARYRDRLTQVVTVHKNGLRAQGITETDARDLARKDMTEFLIAAKKTGEQAIAAGFRMTARERQAFRSIYGAFTSSLVLDPTLLRQVHRLHDHVLENLTVDMLMADGNTLRDEAEAQLKFLQNGRDKDMLAAFMALAQISPSLRNALTDMQAPLSAEVKWNSVDDAVNSVGSAAMSFLTRASLQKPGRLGSVGKELDRLNVLLSEMESENRILNSMGKLGDRIEASNDFASKYLDKGSKAASDALGKVQAKQKWKAGKIAASAVGMLVAMGSKDASAERGESLTTMMNNVEGWDSVRAALHDLRGATKSNLPILRQVNLVKAKIDAMRQDFREGVPKILAKEFSRKLSRQGWSALHAGLAGSDLMSIGLTEARALLKDPSSHAGRVSAAEETLAGLSSTHADRYKAKAKALAVYMVKGDVTSRHLLKNAKAIAHLFGEADRPDPKTVTDDLIKAVERLVGLYAYGELDADTRTAIEDLAQTEAKGMETVTGLLASVRELERRKSLSDDPSEANIALNIALNNAIQGYIPALGSGGQVIVADASEHEKLRMTGWTRIGDYHGDAREGSRVKRAYYQSNVAGKASFRQGIAQTVHATYSGVNARTGQLLEGTAETLQGVRAQRIGMQAAAAAVGSLDGIPAGEHLIPVFDGEGNVVAYDRPLMKDKTMGLQKDTHLGRMLGVWSGRLLEEEAAHEFNRTLVETLHQTYEKDLAEGRGGEYINVADRSIEDPIIRDAWATMGTRIKDDATEIFGQENFLPVRRELVNDAIGYRSASITDMWTGQSRVSEPIRNAVKEIATAIFKENAYRNLKRAEEVVQNGEMSARPTRLAYRVLTGQNRWLLKVKVTGELLKYFTQCSNSSVPLTALKIHKTET
jgi:hypothetical protein